MRRTAHSFDFIVIGSGGGGFCAALAAKAAGLNPLILEKQAKVGGSTAISGGVVWLPDNPLMKREGIADSFDQAFTYLENFTKDVGLASTPQRRRAFLENVSPMVEFLNRLGMKFERCAGYSDYYDTWPGGNAKGRSLQAALFNLNELGDWKSRMLKPQLGMPARTSEARELFLVNRTREGRIMGARLGARLFLRKMFGTDYRGSGAALQGRMLQLVLKAEIPIWTETAFREFIVTDGCVTGVEALQNGIELQIAARSGVLIAAGGFARNLRMREHYQPAPASVEWTKANDGDTGDGIEAAIRLGAGYGLMDQAWWIPSSIPPGSPPMHNVGDISKPYGIMVDHGGNRFANESNSYMEVGGAIYTRNRTHPAIPAWYVMDARHRAYYPWFKTPPALTPKEWYSSGFLKKADTLEALAAQCGIDAGGLKNTVTRFNGFARKGVDEDFHRGESAYNNYFGDPTVKPNPNLGPIERAPFYAIALYPGDAGTAGGVYINEHGQVITSDAKPIPGLYACGNATASLSGPFYAGAGLSIGASFVFGYISARDAAGVNR